MKTNDEIQPYKLRVTFYKQSGKLAYEAVATTNLYSFEDGFKQAIVDTQDGITDGWQGEFFVVVQNYNPDYDVEKEPFVNNLYWPGDFVGINKSKE